MTIDSSRQLGDAARSFDDVAHVHAANVGHSHMSRQAKCALTPHMECWNSPQSAHENRGP